MKNVRKTAYLKYCAFYFVLYATLGTINPYINVYFEKIGFTGSEIGTIAFVSGLMGLFFAPLCGYLCDKTGKRKLVFGILIALASAALIIFTRQSALFMIALFYILFATFKVDFNSLADALAIQFCNTYKKNYSTVRMMGSFGYIFGSSIIAYVMSKLLGIDGPYFTICFGMYLILIFLLFFIPRVIETKNVEEIKEKAKVNVSALMRNKPFLFILILSGLTTIVSDAYGNYLGNHIVYTLGVDSSYIGTSTLCMVAPEILLVALAPKIFKKLGTKKAYIMSFSLQVVRLVVYAFSNNIYAVLAASTLHGFSTMIGCVGNVNFIGAVAGEDSIASAFSIYGAFYGIAGSLYAKLFGTIYSLSGSNMIFIVSAGAFIVAILICLKTSCFRILDKVYEEQETVE